MRSRSRLVGLVVSGALVVLAAALATLQYRWLGQVSEAERESLHSSLSKNAEEFADDFDRELTRAYVQLQTDSDAMARHEWSAFAARYDTWRDAARDPRLVKAIYFSSDEGTGPAFFEFHPGSRTFEPAKWPEVLAPVKSSLEAARVPGTAPKATAGFANTITEATLKPTLVAMHDQTLPSVPALVIPLPSMPIVPFQDLRTVFSMRLNSSAIILLLDREFLQSTLLPALVERHFSRDSQYRFAIVDNTDTAHPVYARGLAAGATLDPARADKAVPIFAVRSDLVRSDVAKISLQSGAGRSAQITVEGRALTAAPMIPRGAPPPPPPAVTSVAGAVGGTAGIVRQTGSIMSFVFDTRSTPRQDVIRYAVQPGPGWTLVMQHMAGSLDAAVDRTRIRNLWLSFGILSVLAAGVGLVVVNAERSRKLAVQQMDFVATVSHELRTPLTVIRSAAQNLSAGVVSDPTQAKRYGDLIESEGRRLTDMVEQVLEYAGLSGNRGLTRAQLVDAGSLMRDIADSSGPLFEAERCEVEVQVAEPLAPILADEGAIRRAINNLIVNALKYGADGRWIRIAAAAGRGYSGHEVQLSVSDRGRGIEPDDLPHIFEAFYRGRYAVDRQIHGNGLGLSLVKRIAEAHDGRVTVVSTPGQGATFTIHLPAATPDTSAVTPLADPSPESGSQPA